MNRRLEDRQGKSDTDEASEFWSENDLPKLRGLLEFGVMVLCSSGFLMINKYCKLLNINSL
jgi:hypothetical protein